MIARVLVRPGRWIVGGVALALFAGCAGQATDEVPAAPSASAGALAASPSTTAVAAVTAFTVADAIPEAQAAAVISSFNANLKTRLSTRASAWRLVPERDRPMRLVLDADRAFEVNSAQLKPELLLPLSEALAATRGTGAWVLHVIGHGEGPVGSGLAERRANSVAAWLAEQGQPGGRLRTEGRADGSAKRVELVFVPIVVGREVRAWMQPETPAVSR